MSTAARMPFIMPDGSRLTHLLGEAPDTTPGKRGKSKRSKRRPHEQRMQLRFEVGSDYEAEEVQAASKLGARRHLRWLNERLLRQMSGPMTAKEMVSLFSPVPFGEHKESALQVALADAPELWDRLRQIDMDKETKLLERWQEHNAAGSSGKQAPPPSAAAHTVRSWQRVGKKSRAALQKLHIDRVHELEAELLEFQAADAFEAVLAVPDPFERCAAHGLCTFHGLHAHSIDTAEGRALKARKRARTTAAGLKSLKAVTEPSASWELVGDGGGGDGGALENAALPVRTPGANTGGDFVEVAAGAHGDSGVQSMGAFTVVDVLLVLQDISSVQSALCAESLEQHRREHFPSDWIAVES